ncbi:hypothetical protein HBI94_044870 [Parastagonospora nodorum]|nr:hypothetical protein HBI94_044870 [Parastagonospora nodorum]KAH5977356.1 hypothetical protein HBI86_032810 [Parastagonospora nodorum]
MPQRGSKAVKAAARRELGSLYASDVHIDPCDTAYFGEPDPEPRITTLEPSLRHYSTDYHI